MIKIHEQTLERIAIKKFVKCDVDALEKFEKSSLSAHAIGVYYILSLKLLIHSNIAEVSISDIVRFSKSSKSTVIRCLKELEREGFIQINKMDGKKTFYQLSFSFNGQQKTGSTSITQTPAVHSSGITETPVNSPTGITQTLVLSSPYKKNIKKKKTTSKKRDDDVFLENNSFRKSNYQKDKLELCKKYMNQLKALKLINIKTTDAQYISGIYDKNNDMNTWDNLKEKINDLDTKIKQKQNPVQFVEVSKIQDDLESTSEETSNVDVDKLKQRDNYADEYQAILKGLQEENPMLKQGVFADRLVHAQMHENLLVGEGKS